VYKGRRGKIGEGEGSRERMENLNKHGRNHPQTREGRKGSEVLRPGEKI
jgi:hypothetical protein